MSFSKDNCDVDENQEVNDEICRSCLIPRKSKRRCQKETNCKIEGKCVDTERISLENKRWSLALKCMDLQHSREKGISTEAFEREAKLIEQMCEENKFKYKCPAARDNSSPNKTQEFPFKTLTHPSKPSKSFDNVHHQRKSKNSLDSTSDTSLINPSLFYINEFNTNQPNNDCLHSKYCENCWESPNWGKNRFDTDIYWEKCDNEGSSQDYRDNRFDQNHFGCNHWQNCYDNPNISNQSCLKTNRSYFQNEQNFRTNPLDDFKKPRDCCGINREYFQKWQEFSKGKPDYTKTTIDYQNQDYCKGKSNCFLGSQDKYLNRQDYDHIYYCFAHQNSGFNRANYCKSNPNCITTNCGSTSYGSTNYGITNYGKTNCGITNYSKPNCSTNYDRSHYGSTNCGSTNYGSTHCGTANCGSTNCGMIYPNYGNNSLNYCRSHAGNYTDLNHCKSMSHSKNVNNCRSIHHCRSNVNNCVNSINNCKSNTNYCNDNKYYCCINICYDSGNDQSTICKKRKESLANQAIDTSREGRPRSRKSKIRHSICEDVEEKCRKYGCIKKGYQETPDRPENRVSFTVSDTTLDYPSSTNELNVHLDKNVTDAAARSGNIPLPDKRMIYRKDGSDSNKEDVAQISPDEVYIHVTDPYKDNTSGTAEEDFIEDDNRSDSNDVIISDSEEDIHLQDTDMSEPCETDADENSAFMIEINENKNTNMEVNQDDANNKNSNDTYNTDKNNINKNDNDQNYNNKNNKNNNSKDKNNNENNDNAKRSNEKTKNDINMSVNLNRCGLNCYCNTDMFVKYETNTPGINTENQKSKRKYTNRIRDDTSQGSNDFDTKLKILDETDSTNYDETTDNTETKENNQDVCIPLSNKCECIDISIGNHKRRSKSYNNIPERSPIRYGRNENLKDQKNRSKSNDVRSRKERVRYIENCSCKNCTCEFFCGCKKKIGVIEREPKVSRESRKRSSGDKDIKTQRKGNDRFEKDKIRSENSNRSRESKKWYINRLQSNKAGINDSNRKTYSTNRNTYSTDRNTDSTDRNTYSTDRNTYQTSNKQEKIRNLDENSRKHGRVETRDESTQKFKEPKKIQGEKGIKPRKRDISIQKDQESIKTDGPRYEIIEKPGRRSRSKQKKVVSTKSGVRCICDDIYDQFCKYDGSKKVDNLKKYIESATSRSDTDCNCCHDETVEIIARKYGNWEDCGGETKKKTGSRGSNRQDKYGKWETPSKQTNMRTRSRQSSRGDKTRREVSSKLSNKSDNTKKSSRPTSRNKVSESMSDKYGKWETPIKQIKRPSSTKGSRPEKPSKMIDENTRIPSNYDKFIDSKSIPAQKETPTTQPDRKTGRKQSRSKTPGSRANSIENPPDNINVFHKIEWDQTRQTDEKNFENKYQEVSDISDIDSNTSSPKQTDRANQTCSYVDKPKPNQTFGVAPNKKPCTSCYDCDAFKPGSDCAKCLCPSSCVTDFPRVAPPMSLQPLPKGERTNTTVIPYRPSDSKGESSRRSPPMSIKRMSTDSKNESTNVVPIRSDQTDESINRVSPQINIKPIIGDSKKVPKNVASTSSVDDSSKKSPQTSKKPIIGDSKKVPKIVASTSSADDDESSKKSPQTSKQTVIGDSKNVSTNVASISSNKMDESDTNRRSPQSKKPIIEDSKNVYTNVASISSNKMDTNRRSPESRKPIIEDSKNVSTNVASISTNKMDESGTNRRSPQSKKPIIEDSKNVSTNVASISSNKVDDSSKNRRLPQSKKPVADSKHEDSKIKTTGSEKQQIKHTKDTKKERSKVKHVGSDKIKEFDKIRALPQPTRMDSKKEGSNVPSVRSDNSSQTSPQISVKRTADRPKKKRSESTDSNIESNIKVDIKQVSVKQVGDSKVSRVESKYSDNESKVGRKSQKVSTKRMSEETKDSNVVSVCSDKSTECDISQTSQQISVKRTIEETKDEDSIVESVVSDKSTKQNVRVSITQINIQQTTEIDESDESDVSRISQKVSIEESSEETKDETSNPESVRSDKSTECDISQVSQKISIKQVSEKTEDESSNVETISSDKTTECNIKISITQINETTEVSKDEQIVESKSSDKSDKSNMSVMSQTVSIKETKDETSNVETISSNKSTECEITEVSQKISIKQEYEETKDESSNMETISSDKTTECNIKISITQINETTEISKDEQIVESKTSDKSDKSNMSVMSQTVSIKETKDVASNVETISSNKSTECEITEVSQKISIKQESEETKDESSNVEVISSDKTTECNIKVSVTQISIKETTEISKDEQNVESKTSDKSDKSNMSVMSQTISIKETKDEASNVETISSNKSTECEITEVSQKISIKQESEETKDESSNAETSSDKTTECDINVSITQISIKETTEVSKDEQIVESKTSDKSDESNISEMSQKVSIKESSEETKDEASNAESVRSDTTECDISQVSQKISIKQESEETKDESSNAETISSDKTTESKVNVSITQISIKETTEVTNDEISKEESVCSDKGTEGNTSQNSVKTISKESKDESSNVESACSDKSDESTSQTSQQVSIKRKSEESKDEGSTVESEASNKSTSQTSEQTSVDQTSEDSKNEGSNESGSDKNQNESQSVDSKDNEASQESGSSNAEENLESSNRMLRNSLKSTDSITENASLQIDWVKYYSSVAVVSNSNEKIKNNKDEVSTKHISNRNKSPSADSPGSLNEENPLSSDSRTEDIKKNILPVVSKSALRSDRPLEGLHVTYSQQSLKDSNKGNSQNFLNSYMKMQDSFYTHHSQNLLVKQKSGEQRMTRDSLEVIQLHRNEAHNPDNQAQNPDNQAPNEEDEDTKHGSNCKVIRYKKKLNKRTGGHKKKGNGKVQSGNDQKEGTKKDNKTGGECSKKGDRGKGYKKKGDDETNKGKDNDGNEIIKKLGNKKGCTTVIITLVDLKGYLKNRNEEERKKIGEVFIDKTDDSAQEFDEEDEEAGTSTDEITDKDGIIIDVYNTEDSSGEYESDSDIINEDEIWDAFDDSTDTNDNKNATEDNGEISIDDDNDQKVDENREDEDDSKNKMDEDKRKDETDGNKDGKVKEGDDKKIAAVTSEGKELGGKDEDRREIEDGGVKDGTIKDDKDYVKQGGSLENVKYESSMESVHFVNNPDNMNTTESKPENISEDNKMAQSTRSDIENNSLNAENISNDDILLDDNQISITNKEKFDKVIIKNEENGDEVLFGTSDKFDRIVLKTEGNNSPSLGKGKFDLEDIEEQIKVMKKEFGLNDDNTPKNKQINTVVGGNDKCIRDACKNKLKCPCGESLDGETHTRDFQNIYAENPDLESQNSADAKKDKSIPKTQESISKDKNQNSIVDKVKGNNKCGRGACRNALSCPCGENVRRETHTKDFENIFAENPDVDNQNSEESDKSDVPRIQESMSKDKTFINQNIVETVKGNNKCGRGACKNALKCPCGENLQGETHTKDFGNIFAENTDSDSQESGENQKLEPIPNLQSNMAKGKNSSPKGLEEKPTTSKQTDNFQPKNEVYSFESDSDDLNASGSRESTKESEESDDEYQDASSVTEDMLRPECYKNNTQIGCSKYYTGCECFEKQNADKTDSPNSEEEFVDYSDIVKSSEKFVDNPSTNESVLNSQPGSIQDIRGGRQNSRLKWEIQEFLHNQNFSTNNFRKLDDEDIPKLIHHGHSEIEKVEKEVPEFLDDSLESDCNSCCSDEDITMSRNCHNYYVDDDGNCYEVEYAEQLRISKSRQNYFTGDDENCQIKNINKTDQNYYIEDDEDDEDVVNNKKRGTRKHKEGNNSHDRDLANNTKRSKKREGGQKYDRKRPKNGKFTSGEENFSKNFRQEASDHKVSISDHNNIIREKERRKRSKVKEETKSNDDDDDEDDQKFRIQTKNSDETEPSVVQNCLNAENNQNINETDEVTESEPEKIYVFNSYEKSETNDDDVDNHRINVGKIAKTKHVKGRNASDSKKRLDRKSENVENNDLEEYTETGQKVKTIIVQNEEAQKDIENKVDDENSGSNNDSDEIKSDAKYDGDYSESSDEIEWEALKRATINIKRSTEDSKIRNTADELRSTLGSIRSTEESVKRSTTESARRSTAENAKRSKTENVRRSTAENLRNTAESVRRSTHQNVRSSVENVRNRAESVRRSTAENIRRSKAENVKKNSKESVKRITLERQQRFSSKEKRFIPETSKKSGEETKRRSTFEEEEQFFYVKDDKQVRSFHSDDSNEDKNSTKDKLLSDEKLNEENKLDSSRISNKSSSTDKNRSKLEGDEENINNLKKNFNDRSKHAKNTESSQNEHKQTCCLANFSGCDCKTDCCEDTEEVRVNSISKNSFPVKNLEEPEEVEEPHQHERNSNYYIKKSLFSNNSILSTKSIEAKKSDPYSLNYYKEHGDTITISESFNKIIQSSDSKNPKESSEEPQPLEKTPGITPKKSPNEIISKPSPIRTKVSPTKELAGEPPETPYKKKDPKDQLSNESDSDAFSCEFYEEHHHLLSEQVNEMISKESLNRIDSKGPPTNKILSVSFPKEKSKKKMSESNNLRSDDRNLDQNTEKRQASVHTAEADNTVLEAENTSFEAANTSFEDEDHSIKTDSSFLPENIKNELENITNELRNIANQPQNIKPIKSKDLAPAKTSIPKTHPLKQSENIHSQTSISKFILPPKQFENAVSSSSKETILPSQSQQTILSENKSSKIRYESDKSHIPSEFVSSQNRLDDNEGLCDSNRSIQNEMEENQEKSDPNQLRHMSIIYYDECKSDDKKLYTILSMMPNEIITEIYEDRYEGGPEDVNKNDTKENSGSLKEQKETEEELEETTQLAEDKTHINEDGHNIESGQNVKEVVAKKFEGKKDLVKKKRQGSTDQTIRNRSVCNNNTCAIKECAKKGDKPDKDCLTGYDDQLLLDELMDHINQNRKNKTGSTKKDKLQKNESQTEGNHKDRIQKDGIQKDVDKNDGSRKDGSKKTESQKDGSQKDESQKDEIQKDGSHKDENQSENQTNESQTDEIQRGKSKKDEGHSKIRKNKPGSFHKRVTIEDYADEGTTNIQKDKITFDVSQNGDNSETPQGSLKSTCTINADTKESLGETNPLEDFPSEEILFVNPPHETIQSKIAIRESIHKEPKAASVSKCCYFSGCPTAECLILSCPKIEEVNCQNKDCENCSDNDCDNEICQYSKNDNKSNILLRVFNKPNNYVRRMSNRIMDKGKNEINTETTGKKEDNLGLDNNEIEFKNNLNKNIAPRLNDPNRSKGDQLTSIPNAPNENKVIGKKSNEFSVHPNIIMKTSRVFTNIEKKRRVTGYVSNIDARKRYRSKSPSKKSEDVNEFIVGFVKYLFEPPGGNKKSRHGTKKSFGLTNTEPSKDNNGQTGESSGKQLEGINNKDLDVNKKETLNEKKEEVTNIKTNQDNDDETDEEELFSDNLLGEDESETSVDQEDQEDVKVEKLRVSYEEDKRDTTLSEDKTNPNGCKCGKSKRGGSKEKNTTFIRRFSKTKNNDSRSKHKKNGRKNSKPNRKSRRNKSKERNDLDISQKDFVNESVGNEDLNENNKDQNIGQNLEKAGNKDLDETSNKTEDKSSTGDENSRNLENDDESTKTDDYDKKSNDHTPRDGNDNSGNDKNSGNGKGNSRNGNGNNSGGRNNYSGSRNHRSENRNNTSGGRNSHSRNRNGDSKDRNPRDGNSKKNENTNSNSQTKKSDSDRQKPKKQNKDSVNQPECLEHINKLGSSNPGTPSTSSGQNSSISTQRKSCQQNDANGLNRSRNLRTRPGGTQNRLTSCGKLKSKICSPICSRPSPLICSRPNPPTCTGPNPPTCKGPKPAIVNEYNPSICNEPNPSTCNKSNPSTCHESNQPTCNEPNPIICNEPNPITCNKPNPPTCNELNPPICNEIYLLTCNEINPLTCNELNSPTCNELNPSICKRPKPSICKGPKQPICKMPIPPICKKTNPLICNGAIKRDTCKESNKSPEYVNKTNKTSNIDGVVDDLDKNRNSPTVLNKSPVIRDKNTKKDSRMSPNVAGKSSPPSCQDSTKIADKNGNKLPGSGDSNKIASPNFGDKSKPIEDSNRSRSSRFGDKNRASLSNREDSIQSRPFSSGTKNRICSPVCANKNRPLSSKELNRNSSPKTLIPNRYIYARCLNEIRNILPSTVNQNISPNSIDRNTSPNNIDRNTSPNNINRNTSPNNVDRNTSCNNRDRNTSPNNKERNISPKSIKSSLPNSGNQNGISPPNSRNQNRIDSLKAGNPIGSSKMAKTNRNASTGSSRNKNDSSNSKAGNKTLSGPNNQNQIDATVIQNKTRSTSNRVPNLKDKYKSSPPGSRDNTRENIRRPKTQNDLRKNLTRTTPLDSNPQNKASPLKTSIDCDPSGGSPKRSEKNLQVSLEHAKFDVEYLANETQIGKNLQTVSQKSLTDDSVENINNNIPKLRISYELNIPNSKFDKCKKILNFYNKYRFSEKSKMLERFTRFGRNSIYFPGKYITMPMRQSKRNKLAGKQNKFPDNLNELNVSSGNVTSKSKRNQIKASTDDESNEEEDTSNLSGDDTSNRSIKENGSDLTEKDPNSLLVEEIESDLTDEDETKMEESRHKRKNKKRMDDQSQDSDANNKSISEDDESNTESDFEDLTDDSDDKSMSTDDGSELSRDNLTSDPDYKIKYKDKFLKRKNLDDDQRINRSFSGDKNKIYLENRDVAVKCENFQEGKWQKIFIENKKKGGRCLNKYGCANDKNGDESKKVLRLTHNPKICEDTNREDRKKEKITNHLSDCNERKEKDYKGRVKECIKKVKRCKENVEECEENVKECKENVKECKENVKECKEKLKECKRRKSLDRKKTDLDNPNEEVVENVEDERNNILDEEPTCSKSKRCLDIKESKCVCKKEKERNVLKIEKRSLDNITESKDQNDSNKDNLKNERDGRKQKRGNNSENESKTTEPDIMDKKMSIKNQMTESESQNSLECEDNMLRNENELEEDENREYIEERRFGTKEMEEESGENCVDKEEIGLGDEMEDTQNDTRKEVVEEEEKGDTINEDYEKVPEMEDPVQFIDFDAIDREETGKCAVKTCEDCGVNQKELYALQFCDECIKKQEIACTSRNCSVKQGQITQIFDNMIKDIKSLIDSDFFHDCTHNQPCKNPLNDLDKTRACDEYFERLKERCCNKSCRNSFEVQKPGFDCQNNKLLGDEPNSQNLLNKIIKSDNQICEECLHNQTVTYILKIFDEIKQNRSNSCQIYDCPSNPIAGCSNLVLGESIPNLNQKSRERLFGKRNQKPKCNNHFINTLPNHKRSITDQKHLTHIENLEDFSGSDQNHVRNSTQIFDEYLENLKTKWYSQIAHNCHTTSRCDTPCLNQTPCGYTKTDSQVCGLRSSSKKSRWRPFCTGFIKKKRFINRCYCEDMFEGCHTPNPFTACHHQNECSRTDCILIPSCNSLSKKLSYSSRKKGKNKKSCRSKPYKSKKLTCSCFPRKRSCDIYSSTSASSCCSSCCYTISLCPSNLDYSRC